MFPKRNNKRRFTDKFTVQNSKTERLRKSAIPYIQSLQNKEALYKKHDIRKYSIKKRDGVSTSTWYEESYLEESVILVLCQWTLNYNEEEACLLLSSL